MSDLTLAWHSMGARPMQKPRGSRAAWRLRAPRRSTRDWCIEANHGSYLGEHPYNLGDDAWRISVQFLDVDRDVFVESKFEIATSEVDAVRKVHRLAEMIGDES